MQSIGNQIPDSDSLALIRENNLKDWEQLYDKYAPVMYGVICAHTTDKSQADEILIDLFIRLKNEEILLKINFALCAYIIRYTYTNTRKELKKRGKNYTEIPRLENSAIHHFCSQHTTLKKAAEKLRMSENEVKIKLYEEFLILRSKNNDSNPKQQLAIKEHGLPDH